MTRTILLVATLLLPLYTFGQRKSKAPTPSTTQLEANLATAICRDLTQQNATKPFAQLSKEEALETLQNSMMRAMDMPEYTDQVERLIQSSPPNSTVMRDLGGHIATKLTAECPVAAILFARSVDHPAGAAVTSLDPKALEISAAERPLLQQLAKAACAELSQAAAQPAPGTQTFDQRMQLIQQAMQRVVKAHAKDISAQYGADIFANQQQLQILGIKVGSLMADQCPSALTPTR